MQLLAGFFLDFSIDKLQLFRSSPTKTNRVYHSLRPEPETPKKSDISSSSHFFRYLNKTSLKNYPLAFYYQFCRFLFLSNGTSHSQNSASAKGFAWSLSWHPFNATPRMKYPLKISNFWSSFEIETEPSRLFSLTILLSKENWLVFKHKKIQLVLKFIVVHTEFLPKPQIDLLFWEPQSTASYLCKHFSRKSFFKTAIKVIIMGLSLHSNSFSYGAFVCISSCKTFIESAIVEENLDKIFLLHFMHWKFNCPWVSKDRPRISFSISLNSFASKIRC